MEKKEKADERVDGGLQRLSCRGQGEQATLVCIFSPAPFPRQLRGPKRSAAAARAWARSVAGCPLLIGSCCLWLCWLIGWVVVAVGIAKKSVRLIFFVLVVLLGRLRFGSCIFNQIQKHVSHQVPGLCREGT